VRVHIARRTGAALLSFLVATAVLYATLVALPVRWVRYLPSRTGGRIDLREHLGLDGSLQAEYLGFLWRFLRSGSTGTSVVYRDDSASVVLAAAPVTAWILAGGIVVALALAVPLGRLSAVSPGSVAARIGTGFVRLGTAAPIFLIAMLLVFAVAFKLGLAPIAGYCDLVGVPPGAPCGGPAAWASHLMLPWATLGIALGALYTMRIRAADGALRPLAAFAATDVAFALGASLFVEHVYGLTGLGRLLVQAGVRFDLPLLVAVMLWATAATLVVRLAVELVAHRPASQGAHSRS
jgi:peptide/nickel transport system permease protein